MAIVVHAMDSLQSVMLVGRLNDIFLVEGCAVFFHTASLGLLARNLRDPDPYMHQTLDKRFETTKPRI